MAVTIGKVRLSFVNLVDAKDSSEVNRPKFASLEQLNEMLLDPRRENEVKDYKFSVNIILPKDAKVPGTNELVSDRLETAVFAAIDYAASDRSKTQLPTKYVPTMKRLWKDSGAMLSETRNILRTVVRDGDNDDRAEGKDYLKGAYNFTADQRALRGNKLSGVPVYAPGAGKPVELDPNDVHSGDYGFVCITPYVYEYQKSYGIKFFLESVLKTEDGDRLDGTVTAEAAFGDVLEAYAEDSTFAFGEVPMGGTEDTEGIEDIFG